MKKIILGALVAASVFGGNLDRSNAFTGDVQYPSYTYIGHNPGTGQRTWITSYKTHTTLNDDTAAATGISTDKDVVAHIKRTSLWKKTMPFAVDYDPKKVSVEKQRASVRYDGIYSEEQKAAIKSKLSAADTADKINTVDFTEKVTKKGVHYTTLKLSNYKIVSKTGVMK
jgi:hypothetical protein